MKFRRRQFLYLAAGAAAPPAVSRIARAQAWPARQVRVIVPFAAGGGTDITARVIGQWLSDRLGQPFVIDNRAGGGTNIGTEAAVRSPADGYTVLVVGTSNTVNPSLYPNLNFNLIRDIAPVGGIIRAPYVMVVNAALPARTVPEFIADARANPGRINMASAGNGTGGHLAGEMFRMMTDAPMQHVPYRGGGPALLDLMSGQVQVYFAGMPETIEYIRSGKVRALAVTTAGRAEALPDVPTVGDVAPGFEASVWFGLGVPANTPAAIIERLNRELNAGLADAKVKQRFAELGSPVFPGSPAEFGRHIAEETEKWAKVVQFSGAKPD